MRYSELVDRTESLLRELPSEDRAHGERVGAICRGLQERQREQGALRDDRGDPELKRELGRLVELLSRRSSKAIPLAKLGRAALADLAGDLKSADTILIECDAQLAVLGL